MNNRRPKAEPFPFPKAEARAIRGRVADMRQSIARTQAEIRATWRCIAAAQRMADALERKRRKSRAKIKKESL